MRYSGVSLYVQSEVEVGRSGNKVYNVHNAARYKEHYWTLLPRKNELAGKGDIKLSMIHSTTGFIDEAADVPIIARAMSLVSRFAR